MTRTWRAMLVVAAVALAGCATGASRPTLGVALADPAWNGKTIPVGMQCSRRGGVNPTTPPLRVGRIPPGTKHLVIEIDNLRYQPDGYDGGQGKFSFEVSGSSEVVVPGIPEGRRTDLPPGVTVIHGHRRTGYPGYAPPCTGGGAYSATVRAMSPANEELATGRVYMGELFY